MKKRRGKKKRFRRVPGYRNLPDPIKHRISRNGILALWREKIAKRIYAPQTLGGLPPFAEVLAKTFWDVEDDAIIDAMMDGDPAFFVAFQIRLDQIDVALVEQGASIAQRAPVIRFKYILDGFRQAAAENLVRRGGKWPLSVPDAPV